MNGDGVVDISDFLVLNQYFGGAVDEICVAGSDANGDGSPVAKGVHKLVNGAPQGR